jgi:hypothetical protein
MTGGWAATNTLRAAVASACSWEHSHRVLDPSVRDERGAALALVEAALDAAEGVVRRMESPAVLFDMNEAHAMLAAALRAVREGA